MKSDQVHFVHMKPAAFDIDGFERVHKISLSSVSKIEKHNKLPLRCYYNFLIKINSFLIKQSTIFVIMSDSSICSIKRKSNDDQLCEILDDSRSTSQFQIKPSHKEGLQEQAIKEIISNVLIEVLDGECRECIPETTIFPFFYVLRDVHKEYCFYCR